MSANEDPILDQSKTLMDPIKWCHYIVKAGYATVIVITLAHVVWFFAAREILTHATDTYLKEYIILPFIGLSVLNVAADLLVRSHRLSLVCKEYISLILFLLFSFYLCLTHTIATVLLGTFVLSVFASTVFSNIKLTRQIFLMSNFALLSSGVKIYIEEQFKSSILMEVFVAWDMLLCSYLLAKVLIRYGQDNLVTLMHFYHQKQSMEEQLKLDLFTGLYNKNTFDDYLPKLMKECKDSNIPLFLAMIDVDHFKQVNDLYGHAVGDRVLLHLAQILKSNRTENLNVFRIGGEEFAILFRDYRMEDVFKICDGMRSIMESSTLHYVDKMSVTFSCGLACMNRQYTSSAEFSGAADSALYTAKRNGRNRIVIYDT